MQLDKWESEKWFGTEDEVVAEVKEGMLKWFGGDVWWMTKSIKKWSIGCRKIMSKHLHVYISTYYKQTLYIWGQYTIDSM